MNTVLRLRRRTMALMVAGAAATLAFAACASGGSDEADGGVNAAHGANAARGAEVAIESFAFVSPRIEVDSGASVTWTNRDAILHTVTSGTGEKQGVPGVSKDEAASPSQMFDQEMDGEGSTLRFTFEEPGEFDYFCSIHPGMNGVVVVR